MTDDAGTPALAARLMELISSSWRSQALYVAAQLRLPDLLADGPQTAEALAAATHTHPPSLRRLLRALATLDICRETSDGAFELTPLGALLRSEAPDSLRSWTIFWGGPQWTNWGHLLDSVRTGQTARKLLAGTQDFEHLARDPELAALFNQAMVELTRLTTQPVVQSYDFTGFKRIVDVGGGYGELLAAVLKAAPGASGVVYDMPHAVEAGRQRLSAAGLAERCEFIAGDFFESVPGPADLCLLKSIIHDWDEERSRVILENCRRALAPGGKILIIERLMPAHPQPVVLHELVARSDLNMLVGPGGRERTESEFQSLLDSAGLRLTQIIPTASTFNLIEAIPRDPRA